jgi:glycosyltransferase involved in cell wall biosynthesis
MSSEAPMTVAFFTDSLEPSGVGEVISLLSRNLSQRQYRQVLICPETPAANLLVEHCPQAAVVRRLTLRDDGHVAELAELVAFLQSEDVQVFHNHVGATWEGDWGTLAARMAGVPVVVTTEHLPCVIERPSERRFKRRINQLADRVIAVSDSVRRTLLRAEISTAEQAVTIRNGIELSRFHHLTPPPEARELLAQRQGPGVRGQGSGALSHREDRGLAGSDPSPLTPDPCLIGTIGRMTEQKGHIHLVRAIPAVAARHPEARFVWIGDGAERSHLEAEARRLGVEEQIWFMGWQRDAWRWLPLFAFTVLPSAFEGLPLAALESMAAGCPVVGARVCGTMDAVEHGETGLLAPPEDPAALAAAILRLLDLPEERARMGERARRRVEAQFSVQRMVREHEELYSRLLALRVKAARSAHLAPGARPPAADYQPTAATPTLTLKS